MLPIRQTGQHLIIHEIPGPSTDWEADGLNIVRRSLGYRAKETQAWPGRKAGCPRGIGWAQFVGCANCASGRDNAG